MDKALDADTDQKAPTSLGIPERVVLGKSCLVTGMRGGYAIQKIRHGETVGYVRRACRWWESASADTLACRWSVAAAMRAACLRYAHRIRRNSTLDCSQAYDTDIECLVQLQSDEQEIDGSLQPDEEHDADQNSISSYQADMPNFSVQILRRKILLVEIDGQ